MLPVGNYYLKEITAPDGYTVMIEIVSGVDSNEMGVADGNGISVTENAQTEVTVENAQQVSIRVIKTDSVTGVRLADANFTLYSDEDCQNAVATGSTNANGELIFGGLTANTTYYIKENSAPAGYAADTSEVYSVTTAAANATVKIVDEEITNDRLGQLHVVKTTLMDAEEGDMTGSPMSGVKFRLYRAVEDENGSYRYPDSGNGTRYSQGEPVTGKPGMDENGIFTTDEDGEAAVGNLEPGFYILAEEDEEGKAPEGYPPHSLVIEIVAGQNQESPAGSGNPYPEVDTSVVNQPDEGKVSVKKVSSLDGNTGLKAVFYLYSPDNATVPAGMIVTGEDGVGTSGWLEPGTYTLKEYSVESGYVADSTERTVTVTAGETNEVYFTAPIPNDPVGKLEILKWDAMDADTAAEYEPMSGVSFKLYRAVADASGTYTDGTTSYRKGEQLLNTEDRTLYPGIGADGLITTDEAGNASVDNLEPGTYILEEEQMEGYPALYRVITIQAGQNRTDLGGTAVPDLEIVNTPSMGKVAIEKIDAETREGLVAAFTLYPETDVTSGNPDLPDAQREYSETGVTLSTDGKGNAVSGWLAPGRYKVVETAAPANYVPDTTPRYITITAGETNTDLTGTGAVTNVPMGRISIYKTALFNVAGADGDALTGDDAAYTRYSLTGAVFDIYEKTPANIDVNGDCTGTNLGNSLATIDLTDTSSGVSGYLEPNKEYWVVETTTPSGYIAIDPIAVTVQPGQTVAANSHPDETGVSPSIDNTPNVGKLRLFKYLRNTGSLLDGAEFELYIVDNTNGVETELEDGSVVKLRQVQASNSSEEDPNIMESGTSGTGSAVTIDLAPGTYYLKEVSLSKAQQGYNQSIPLENWHWEVQWTGPLVVTAGNETQTDPIYNYYVVDGPGIKTSSLNEEGLAGAYFAAFTSQEDAVDALAALDGLVVGKTIQGWTWTNLGELRTALGTDAGKQTFMSTTGAAAIAVSDEDGEFVFEDLVPLTTYYVMEISAPEGYELPTVTTQENDDIIVEVTTNGNGGFSLSDGTDLTFEDVAMGRLQVVKYTTLSGQNFVVEGVTVNVYRAVQSFTGKYEAADGTKYDIRPTDKDSNNNPLPIATGTTDADGLYTSVYLPAGVYIVMEDLTNLPDAVSGTAAGETGYRVIRVTQKQSAEDLAIENTYASIDDADGTNGFHNEAQYGKFLLEKVDSTNSSIHVIATFKVYHDMEGETEGIDRDNPVQLEEGVDYTITTSAAGTVESEFLPAGTYWLVEQERSEENGYTVDPTPIKVTVTGGQLNTALTGNGAVKNDPKGTLIIEKRGVDNSSDPTWTNLAGVIFSLYKKTADNTIVTEGEASANWSKLETETPVRTSITTGTNGQATVQYLDAGEYWLVETGVGSNVNYQVTEPALAVAVKIDAGGTTSLTGDNAVTNNINAGRFALTKLFTGTGASDTDEAAFIVEKVTNEDGNVSYDAENVRRVWDAENGRVDYTSYSFTVDGTETFISEYLEPGTYRITEQSTSTGDYQMAESFLVEITAGTIAASTASQVSGVENVTGSIQVTNMKLGSLTVEKTGVFQDEKVENLESVTFRLYRYDEDANGNWGTDFDLSASLKGLTPVTVKADGQDVTEFKTGSNGQVTVTHIEPGTYWLVETDLGTHDDEGKYSLTGVYPTRIVITSGDNTALTGNSAITNTTLYGKLQITKTDYHSGVLLEGAVFEIYADAGCTGELFGTMTSGGNGIALSGLLPAGSYYLKEVTAPEGYEGMKDSLSNPRIYGPYVIEANKTTGVDTTSNTESTDITNRKQFTIEVTKTDDETGALLDGAVFYLYGSKELAEDNNTTLALAHAATVNGKATFTVTINDRDSEDWANSSQTFYLVEETPPSGYASNTAIHEVTVTYSDPDGKAEITVENEALGRIQLQKNVVWDGRTQGLGGVGFTFYKVEGFGENHKDGAAAAYTGTTEADGSLTTGPLEEGWYEVVETSTPAGYQAETVSHWVQVVNKQTNTALADEPVMNTPYQGNFQLEKVAGDGTTPLGGAVFAFYRQNGSGSYELVDSENSTFTVNFTEGGRAVYSSGMLDPGRYMVKEITAPRDGDIQYSVSGEEIYFEIQAGYTTYLTGDEAVKNYPQMSIVLTKTGDAPNGSPVLAGAVFQLYASDQTTEVGEAVTTDTNGVARWTGIDPGTYYIKEVSAPDGYAVSGEVRQVIVPKSTATVSSELTVNAGTWTNEADMGRLLIRKTDENGTAMLSDAQFNIYGANAQGEYTELMNDQPLTTDHTGTVLSGLLPAAEGGTTYLVVETKAPDGYTLDDAFTQTSQYVTVYPIHNPQYTGESSRNVAAFANKTVASIGVFQPSIRKEVSDDNEGYTDGTVYAEESLLLDSYTVNFRVSGLADGTNDLPADSFTVTDDNIVLYSYDTVTQIYREKTVEAGDYVINQVTVDPASNADTAQQVTAQVLYRTFGSDSWQPAASGLVLDQERTVSLDGLNAVGVQIVYSNVRAGFKADGFTMGVTFAERTGDPDAPEVRRITNDATVDWAYTYRASDGTEQQVTGTNTSNEVEALIPRADELLPQVLLTNTIVNAGSSYTFYTGDTVDFQVKAVNVQNEEGNAPDFRQPVIAVELPAYTTLDQGSGFTVYQTQMVNGVPQNVALVEGRDYTVTAVEGVPAVTAIENGTYIYSNTETTTRYIFTFSEDIALSPDTEAGANSSLTIGYRATIDYDKPSSQSGLFSPAYLSSLYQLPASQENPLGLSFEAYQGSTQVNDNLDSNLNMELEYLNQPVDFIVLNSEETVLVKTVSDELNGNYTTSQVDVYPNENVYYKLTLYNNSTSNLRSVRFIDILPFNGDTFVFRSSGITDRLTTIPNGSGYEEMLLVNVFAEDKYATIYYYVEADAQSNSWIRDNRELYTAEEELPMLYDADGDYWNAENGGYWTTEKPSDMSLVTAVGVEVTLPEGDYLAQGESYTVTLEMKTPGYAAEDISIYEGTVMANSSAAAVVRAGEAQINPTLDIVEPNKVLVGLSLPTGSIGDTAWYDLNNNGIQDDGESSAAANITVELYQTTLTYLNGSTLYRSEEKLIATTTTDGAGHYLFDNLPCNYLATGAAEGSENPDDYVGGTIYYYRVRFSVPANHAVTIRYGGETEQGVDYETDSNIDANGWTDTITLSILNEMVEGREVIAGEDNLTIDAGYVVSVALGDRVWIDLNHDGLQGPDEPGLEGVLVNLYQVDSADGQVEAGDEPIATALTDADGYYLFDQLPQGYYVVEFDIRALTTDGYTYRYAFTDSDRNSTSVFSPDDSDAIYNADSSGRIKRTQVIPLTFAESEVIAQNGSKQDRTWDAGVWVYSALGGYIFEDTNYTDLQDIDTGRMDSPLPGTLVQLYRVINGIREKQPIRETTVGGDGRYFFDELEAGQYQVFFRFPEGYTAVDSPDGDKTPETNLSDTNDSDCCVFTDGNYQSGFTEVITLGYNTVDETWDAGANLLGAIGDYVWFDTDKDGIQDEGEQPISGVTVRLQYRMGDTDTWRLWPGGTTATDETGRYLFTGLPGGDDYDIQYRVFFDFEDPTTTITITNAGTDSAVDSDALGFYMENLGYVTTTIFLGYGETDLTWDAGVIVTVCGMGDFVWYDDNRNGIQDVGEAGVAGIPVVLERNMTGRLDDNSDWTVVGTTTTNENGYYRFLDLQEGYYRVRFQISAPYIATLYNRGTGDNAYQYDSDASMAIGDDWYRSRVFYLEDGQYDWTWDAGLYRLTTEGVDTGDNRNLWFWLSAAGIALTVIGAAGIYARRRKRKI